MNTSFSAKVSLLSFIGAVLVVFRHAKNYAEYSINDGIAYYLQEIISSIALFPVPFFFFVSAFFATKINLSISGIIKKRFKSIFLPYIFYNTIYTCLLLVSSSLFENKMNNPITEIDWFSAILFYKYSNIGWFAFQLVVYTPITPIIRRIFEINKYLSICILTAIFILSLYYTDILFIKPQGFFFYLLGVFAYVYFKNPVEDVNYFSSKEKLLIITTTLLLAQSYYWYNIGTPNTIDTIYRSLMLIAMFFAIDFIKIKARFFMGFTFFMYLGHYYLLEIIQKIIYISPFAKTRHLATFDFFFSSILTVSILCTFAILANKYYDKLPRPFQLLWNLMNGFRKNRLDKKAS